MRIPKCNPLLLYLIILSHRNNRVKHLYIVSVLCYNFSMNTKRRLDFTIPNSYNGKKVLAFLKGEVKASARLITKLKQSDDGILLNGEHVRTVDTLKTGDVLSINIPADKKENISAVESLKYDLEVLYEDEDFLIVNKPAGIANHPSHNHQGDTLANAVAYHLEKNGKRSVFRSVGRLDKGTSGIVICALNRFAAAAVSGKIYKEYEAVCEGVLTGEGVIDAPIYRPDPIITVRTVDERGERAVTEWKALKNVNGRTHLRIHLQTGRTHQIRVHFAHLGMPLTGDTMYGTPSNLISHQALICKYCRFTHPVTGEIIEIEAPTPKDWEKII